MKSPQTPEEAVRELREYINTHIQKWSQKQVARVIRVSEDEYEMIERRRRRLLPNKVEPLVHYLIQMGWLDSQSRAIFQQDLLNGISVVRYISGYRDSRERRQLIPPTVQSGRVIKNADDLAFLREFEGAAGVFVGREESISHMIAFLKEKKRLHLSDIGGVGKTTVALKVVEVYLQQPDLFLREEERPKPRVIWLSAGTGSQSDLEGALLRAANPRSHVDMPLRVALASAKVGLIVLDNVWTGNIQRLMESVPLDVRVVVTSRRDLTFAHQAQLRLPRLDMVSALAIISAGADKEFSNDADAVHLVEVIQRHPLALRIAGSAMRTFQRLPHEIEYQLSTYVFNEETLHEQTLDALIRQNFYGWSSDNTVNETLEAVFLAIGTLFAPRFSLELLQMRLNGLIEDVSRPIDTMIALHMLERIGTSKCYGMHDLIYLLAASKATASSTIQGIETCIRYIEQHIALENGFQSLYEARENLLGSAQAAIQLEDQAAGKALCLQLLYPLAKNGFFDAYGYEEATLNILERSAWHAEALNDNYRAHYLWAKVGNGHAEYTLDYPRAAFAYDKAAIMSVIMQETYFGEAIHRQAICHSLVATALFRSGSYEDAHERFEFAESLAQSHQQVMALSQIYEHRGTMEALIYHNYQTAHDYFRASLNAAEQITDFLAQKQRRFYAYINLAGALDDMNNYTDALTYLQEAYLIAQSLDHPDWQARAAYETGKLNIKLGDLAKAHSELCESLYLFQVVHNANLMEDVQNILDEFNLQCISIDQN